MILVGLDQSKVPKSLHKHADPLRRGHITILDHQLEAASCECYQMVKTEFDRLLG